MELFSLRWNNYLNHVTYAFDSLRNEEDLIDVTLSCEGKKLKAHKMLLSACSPYFRDIFKENPCQHPVIVFRNMKYTDLESIVNYIYKGEVSVQQDQLASFLDTAELLEVKGLSGEESSVGDSVTENVEKPFFAQPNDLNKSLKSSSLPTPVKRRKASNPASGSSQVSQVSVKEERDDEDTEMNNLEGDDGNMGITQALDNKQNNTNTLAEDHLDNTAEDIKLENTKINIKVEAATRHEGNCDQNKVFSKNKPRNTSARRHRNRKAWKSPKSRSSLVKRAPRFLKTDLRQQGKQPLSRPMVQNPAQVDLEEVNFPKGLTVSVSTSSAAQGGAENLLSIDEEMPITRSEGAKTPVVEELYQGIPQGHQEVIGEQFQPVTAQEAPEPVLEHLPTIEEEVKEPEFDYYGCEICKAEAKPCERISFNHKCPICPCLCFCAHLLKEHMRVIHGWFNVQRKFTPSF